MPYGEEEMAILEEDVLPALAVLLQRLEVIESKGESQRRLSQREGCCNRSRGINT